MEIIQPYARIQSLNGVVRGFQGWDTAGVNALRWIEWCGRISHRTEDAADSESWKRFIPATVMGHGDWSIVEHVNATVDAVVDRGITHEIVRHRLFSFTQESTRFVNYEKKMPPKFVMPEVFINSALLMDDWKDAIDKIEKAYLGLIRAGVSPQISRSVLPNALASRIVMTSNLRNWRHFLIMRTTKESHPQMRQVTIPLLEEFKSMVPLLFDDIVPEARQADNLRLPR